MTKPFSISPAEYADALNVMGDKINVLARRETTGSYAITLVQGHEGNGPPPHSHQWDESFFVIRGEVEFTFEGKTKRAVTGTLVHFPAGTVHSFTFCKGGADVLEITGEGTQAIEMFSALDREIAAGSNDLARTAEVLEQNGVKLAI
ncbi:MAG: cupin domain-containing protein [Roseibium sp.]|uniref:cupin domain-containing protein n=1 Tax=Roseibium sp. TaxID=1936156 RepID=UPI00261FBBF7|nr:cupin domain-containing protein [Roseibium sp.]MCV0428129.1 cupin domain-containing protein [Roseibium sp.]